MRITSDTMRRFLAMFFVFALVLQIPLIASAQRPWPTTPAGLDVIIGRPSIWTLAQAHYLLAQMHKEDRALKVKALGEIDPNAINRQRIEVLQTLIGITGEFDQAAKVKNDILQQRYETNTTRQQTVQTELDRRNNDLIQINRDLYFITVDLNRLKTAKPPDEDAIKAKTDEQEAKTLEKQSIVDRIGALNTELTRLQTEIVNTNLPQFTGPFSSAQPTPAPLANKLNNLIDSNFLNKLYADTANKSSALQASIQLDNYIQGQYELIAKQLTLLRDEVGATERVIFLELPSAVYSVPKRGDNYVAQVRWQVRSYCSDEKGTTSECAHARATANSQTGTSPSSSPTPSTSVNQTASPSQSPNPSRSPTSTPVPDLDESSIASLKDPQSGANQETYEQAVTRVATELGLRPEPKPSAAATPSPDCWHEATPDLVRTVDIIPRQSALNVNSIHQTSSGLAIAARFMSIFGFGGKVDYQRQRDVYDQFVYQDIFASGFGKGSNVFGWTFGALPGTKALAPGVRTTFAVLVIPADARKIEVVGKGYAFRRSEYQPALTGTPLSTDCFQIPIPGEDTNRFWVDSADYATVQSGKRLTLVLGGPYFSPQIGVLVNGVPLERVVAIAPMDFPSPPATPANSSTGNANTVPVFGQYEFVNPRRLILSFAMPNDYEGTPVIALVTPDKTSIINRYAMNVNQSTISGSLEMHSQVEPMFLMPLAITKVEFTQSNPGYLNAVISGRGFRPKAKITINGTPVFATQRSTHQYDIIFARPTEPSWDLTIRQNTMQGQEVLSFPLNRPLAPQITYDILRYSPPRGRQQAQMDLRFTGAGFQRIDYVQLLQNGSLSPEWRCAALSAAVPPSPNPAPRGRRGPRPTPPPPQGICAAIGGGEVLVTLRLPNDVRNESLVFVVTGTHGESAILNILPPAAPTITSIVNDVTKNAQGSTEGGYSVAIRGQNLEQVDRVLFGTKPAAIQQSAGGVITVQAPKNEEGPVRVLLETNTIYQNKILTNSADFADLNNTKPIFTYVKPKP